MNIIKREVRANLKSLLIWSVSISAIIVMMMSEFSAYYNNPDMLEILNAIPEVFLKAFSIDGANLTTVSGFLSMASFYFYIMLSVHSALLGSSIISKEERDKTTEFFMTLPISRTHAVLSKLFASILLCLTLNLVTGASILLTALPYEKTDDFTRFFILMMIALFIMQIIFLALGMLTASIIKRYRRSATYSMALLFGLYIMSIFVSLSDKVEFLKYITPFKFFETGTILRDEKLELVYLLISFGIIVGSLTGTLIFYPKRDLYL